MLAQETLKVPFISFGENLFNDRAVVMPTPHRAPFRPQTDSVAMRAGWRWSIPLTSRVGNGYVYSSRYISDESAEAELRSAIGMQGDEQPARFLRMKVGRVKECWSRNVLATGLAQGFIEPLEATALHIVIATALEFADAYAAGGFTAARQDDFNCSIGSRYDAIRDYIVAHYRMNQRGDSDYWRDNAANTAISGSLKEMITAWFTHQDVAAANAQVYAVPAYSGMSWHCLFAGYGTFPPQEKMRALPDGLATTDSSQVRAMLAACAQNFHPMKGTV
jgi:tryptophan 6-halogenase